MDKNIMDEGDRKDVTVRNETVRKVPSKGKQPRVASRREAAVGHDDTPATQLLTLPPQDEIDTPRSDLAMLADRPLDAPPKLKHVGIDTRSREAFELLKLGEAICNLQTDQRKMRLNSDDMRFERDRYKASAASFQDKLTESLKENARLRDLREVLRSLSLQVERTSATQLQEAQEERIRFENMLQEAANDRARLVALLYEMSRQLDASTDRVEDTA